MACTELQPGTLPEAAQESAHVLDGTNGGKQGTAALPILQHSTALACSSLPLCKELWSRYALP